jgi:hypothetical protein
MSDVKDDDMPAWNRGLFSTMALDEPTGDDRAKVAQALGLTTVAAGAAAGLGAARTIAECRARARPPERLAQRARP